MNFKGYLFILIILFISLINFSRVFGFSSSYALLTEDFGVLNEQDFILKEGEAPPGPIIGNYSAFKVWQCFSTENAEYHISCNDYTEPNLVVISSDQLHDFYFRRRFEDYEDCLEVITQWKKLITSEDAFCVKGYFSGTETIPNSEEKKFFWTIDRIKSSKGCWSYFWGGCGEKEDLENNYLENPDLQALGNF